MAMLKGVILPGLATLVVLAAFFYLVGVRGPMLVVLAVVPTLIGTVMVWIRARKALAR